MSSFCRRHGVWYVRYMAVFPSGHFQNHEHCSGYFPPKSRRR